MAGAKPKQVEKLRNGRKYRKQEAAKVLGVSRPTIDRMIEDGRLMQGEYLGIITVEKP